MKTTFRHIRHAAHYMYQPTKGHDLEQWDVTDPIGRMPVQPLGVPSDAKFHSGYIDSAGVQHWVYTRIAPLSEGTCLHCEGRS